MNEGCMSIAPATKGTRTLAKGDLEEAITNWTVTIRAVY
jgi:hypothetical protein